jgi:bifunctional DNase/RNase
VRLVAAVAHPGVHAFSGRSPKRDTQAIGLGEALDRVHDVKHVELLGLTVETSSRAPLVLLREHDEPHRVLPIFIGPVEAAAIALALGNETPPRPLTHDLLATLVDTAQARVERVEVTELRDGTFLADLALSGPTGERRVDSRPSDAIALALRVDAPLYVASAVLDEAGALLAETLDEEAIDEEVARFRSVLETLDPTHLQPGPGSEPRAGTTGQDESRDPDAQWDDEEHPDEPEPSADPQDPTDEPGS